MNKNEKNTDLTEKVESVSIYNSTELDDLINDVKCECEIVNEKYTDITEKVESVSMYGETTSKPEICVKVCSITHQSAAVSKNSCYTPTDDNHITEIVDIDNITEIVDIDNITEIVDIDWYHWFIV